MRTMRVFPAGAEMANGHRRRGAVTVQLALSITFVMGFAALSVDVGTMYVARAELQRCADAAAMAAATQLNRSGDPNMEQLARDAANDAAQRNSILGKFSELSLEQDVQFGRAVYDGATNRFEFSPGAEPFDAVEVTVRRAEGSSGGPVELAFARVFGQDKKNMLAKATAMLVPRDIAVVIDLSGSMNYDSQLRSWDRTDGGYQNTRDVWCALDGPDPDRPYLPGHESETQYAADTGPAVGWMNTWGNPLQPGYSASGDPGLWYIKKSSTTSVAAITAKLTAAGYNTAERSAILSGSNDGVTGQFERRTGVMLGLASWKSGKSGGFPGGDGDNLLESSEVTWIGYPDYRLNWTWSEYVSWVQSNSTDGAGTFRYRYGLKTFVDFLLQSKRQANQTRLWDTPQLPMTAIKDAVQTMIDTIAATDTLDHASLHIFATTAKNEILLTDNLQSIAETLYARQAAHYDPTTNIGSGLSIAIDELKSARARPNAAKMIVLMSDGVPNVGETGQSSEAAGIAWAYKQADRAAQEGFPITSIGLGYLADPAVMETIAEISGGQYFLAVGSPEEYSDELQAIFKTLGGKHPVALIK